MKSDLDALMQAHNVDALLVSGPGKHNPAMVYMTGGANLTMGHVIKKRGEPAILFFAPMERDEAARLAWYRTIIWSIPNSGHHCRATWTSMPPCYKPC